MKLSKYRILMSLFFLRSYSFTHKTSIFIKRRLTWGIGMVPNAYCNKLPLGGRGLGTPLPQKGWVMKFGCISTLFSQNLLHIEKFDTVFNTNIGRAHFLKNWKNLYFYFAQLADMVIHTLLKIFFLKPYLFVTRFAPSSYQEKGN